MRQRIGCFLWAGMVPVCLYAGSAYSQAPRPNDRLSIGGSVASVNLSVPDLFGSEVAYGIDDVTFAYGGRVSRSFSLATLSISYLYSRHDLSTRFLSLENPSDPRRQFFAESDIGTHSLTLETSRPLIVQEATGREFSVALGAGVIAFNPSRNTFLFLPSDTPESADIPVELESTIDPILTFGAGIKVPVRAPMTLRIDFRDSVQLCDSGDLGGRHYLCPAWAIRQHYTFAFGVDVKL